jgi:outer membrane biosynthesis protein TonB
MKAGLTTSVAMHVVLIGAGLVSLSPPSALESSNFESFPVEMVPISEISSSVRGERDAPVSERPAPEPTTAESQVDNAQNIGNNEIDLPNMAALPGNRPVESAAPPPPAEEPPPPPVQEAEAPPEPAPEPEPAPVEAEAPEPSEQAVAQEQPRDAVALPDSAPRPQTRPQPQVAQQPPQQREPERPRPTQETAQQPSQDSNFNADEIAALLSQEEARGGGAARSQDQASLGGRNTTGATLSQSEIDSLRSQVSRCWNPPVGAAEAENMVVSIRLRLDPSGALDGNPEIVSGRGASMAERAAADAARRAVMRCAPFNAPADKYEAWADVQFNFDPRDMF